MAGEHPETRYVERSDGVSIAYQVVGSGPIDLVYVPGFISHLDLAWSEPHFAGFLERLASFSRLVLFDKPGTGLSDPIAHVPTVEERRDDIGVVMDDAGCEAPVLLGFSEGVSSCLLFAATWPGRVASLVLYGGIVKGTARGDRDRSRSWRCWPWVGAGESGDEAVGQSNRRRFAMLSTWSA